MITHKLIDVPENNPFENDVLDRIDTIHKLTTLLSNMDTPAVMSIDSPWGTGKTTFLRMWRQHLITNNFNCLYFNAWDTDYVNDPFVSMISEFTTLMSDFKTNDGAFKRRLSSVRQTALHLSKKSLPLLLNLATHGLLDYNEVTEKKLGKLVEQLSVDQIKHYDEQKKTIAHFKTKLTELIQSLTSLKADPKPFIFFIDELDRCRPLYSIELLECAKHIFDIEGVTFVLALDKPQLVASIKSVYGETFNAEGYIRRFIDFDYALINRTSKQFCEQMFKELGITNILNTRKRYERFEIAELTELLSMIMSFLELSLRDQMQILIRLSLIIKSIPDENNVYPLELGLMVVLRYWQPMLYTALCNKMSDPKVMIEELKKLPDPNNFFNKWAGKITEAIILASAASVGINSILISEYNKISSQESKDMLIISRARTISSEIATLLNSEPSQVNFKVTSERIEFGNRFGLNEAS
jgi:hypothetical protein